MCESEGDRRRKEHPNAGRVPSALPYSEYPTNMKSVSFGNVTVTWAIQQTGEALGAQITSSVPDSFSSI